jgi:predicted RNase H-like nuclease (RuvC/YqgF family)
LQFFDKLLENKHMTTNENDIDMTGNADNRSELRTKSGHEINQDVQDPFEREAAKAAIKALERELAEARREIASLRPRAEKSNDYRLAAINAEAEIEGLDRKLTEAREQRDRLADALEYIAHSGLSARHLADYALTVVKEYLK